MKGEKLICSMAPILRMFGQVGDLMVNSVTLFYYKIKTVYLLIKFALCYLVLVFGST